jgi:hypothetical protein
MSLLTNCGRKILDTLCKFLPPPNFEKLRSLSDLHRVLHRIHLPATVKDIPGWMSPKERKTLYALGRFSPGPILEIGAWLGRSTVCIARGIVDSGRKKEFQTCELAPTPANFRSLSETEIGFYYPPESPISMGIASVELYEADIKPIILNPKGVIGQLNDNLAASGVKEVVSIFVGDFRSSPPKPYRLIFSDAMHDEPEITRNARDLYPYLEVGAILACHDTTLENEALLKKYFTFDYSFLVDRLFVGEIRAFKS